MRDLMQPVYIKSAMEPIIEGDTDFELRHIAVMARAWANEMIDQGWGS